MIILLRAGLCWLVGVVCVGVVGKTLLICYCIAMLHVLWRGVLGAFGVQWVLPATVADLLFGWWNWLGNHSFDIWNIVPLYLMWILWWERNQRTFEGEERSTDELAIIRILFNGLGCGVSH